MSGVAPGWMVGVMACAQMALAAHAPLPATPAPSSIASPAAAPGDTVLATLDAWAEDVWLDILDREGTIRGPLAEEGIFQRFHPEMDDEYALDVRTGLFTASGDAAWALAGRGLRAAGSSISHPHILTRVDWRQAFPIARSVELTAEYRRDHSLTDRRDHPRLGVRWRDAGGSGWTLWSRLGVHFFKPAADVEVGARRAWGGEDGGGWRLDLRLAALDAFSDAIFVGLGVDEDAVETHVDHEGVPGVPLAARASVERRGRRWRLEVVGGATTVRRARVTFPGTGEAEPFDLAEEVGFVGGLVELAPAPDVRVAGWGRVARAEIHHAGDRAGSGDLRVVERTTAVGILARHHLTEELAMGAELRGVWRPESRRDGTGSMRHEDRELYGMVSLRRWAAHGWIGRLAWAAMDRDAGVLLPEVSGRNQRLITEAGFRSRTGFSVVVGLRWDLDELGSDLFDGGQLRLATGVPALP